MIAPTIEIQDFKTLLISKIKKTQKQEIYFEEIYRNEHINVFKNEFLFFIKPELTLDIESIKIEEILSFILEKISYYKFEIKNIKILSAKYLKDFDIISKHYGVINKIANDVQKNISHSSKEKFFERFGKDISQQKTLGGFMFLEEYPSFNSLSLDILWQNIENHKLGGGTYVEKVKVDSETVYLVNGFHPRQLDHFTSKGRLLIVFTLASDIDWSIARNEFVGATKPSMAKDGSIRKELFLHQKEFGLPEISQGNNGVHLSAGPVESLVELIRYNSNLKMGEVLNIQDFSFGKLLSQNFNENQIDFIMDNNEVIKKGVPISIFDLTEDLNSQVAIEVLREYIN